MKKTISIFLVSVLGGSLGWAGVNNLDHVLFEMQKKESSLQSIKFNFSQEIEFKEAGVKNKVQGDVQFKKPKKLKISKNTPEKQITISDGKKIWIYTPSYKQVWKGATKDWSLNSNFQGIIPIDSYVSDLKTAYDLVCLDEDIENDKHEVRLKATPKDATMDYRVDLLVSTESWFPIETVYQSGSATVTTRLSQIEMNPELADQQFQFSPPHGTEVIPLN